MNRLKTKTITTSALLTAILCLSAYIATPLGFTPTPITLQTMIISMISIMLPPSAAFLSVLTYTLIGLVGIPVFSGGTGGLGRLLSPTGGYILGFLAAVPTMSFTKGFFIKLSGRFIHKQRLSEIVGYSTNAILVGMTLTYLLGSIYMKLMLGKSFTAVLTLFVLPFIPLDLAKCIAAAVICVPLLRSLGK